MRITITGPESLTLPSAMGGDDQLFTLTQVCTDRGLMVEEAGSGLVKIAGITRSDLISLSTVGLLVAKGAEVTGYQVFFELNDLTEPCPFAPDAYTDPITGREIPKATWETWGQAPGGGHAPVKYGAKWYRSNLEGASGEPVPASEWIDWVSLPPWGVRVKTVDEFKAIQDEYATI